MHGKKFLENGGKILLILRLGVFLCNRLNSCTLSTITIKFTLIRVEKVWLELKQV